MSVQEKMTAIADAIRAKTGGTDALTLDGMAEAISGIEAGGGSSGFDYAVGLCRAFMCATFPSGTELELSFGGKSTPGTSQNMHFDNAFYRTSGLKSVKINCGVTYPSTYSMGAMFESVSDIEQIDLSGFPQPLCPNSLARGFYNCKVLREIIGEFDFSSCTAARVFEGCSVLETVRFTPGTIKLSITFASSPNLTDETIQNIIDGLADMTADTAQTLTLHATVGAKLTDEQMAAATAKNWTLAY